MTEEIKQPSVSEMLRMTGANTAEFMLQIAEHIEKLEEEVAKARARITELDLQNGDQ
jgi:hypothetical protein